MSDTMENGVLSADHEAEATRLTTEGHDALGRGDHKAAEAAFDARAALFDQRNGNEAGSNDLSAAGPPDLSLPDHESSAGRVKAMTAQDQAGADALVSEWGGADSRNFRENMAFADFAATKLVERTPVLADLLESVIEDDEGGRVVLGDHPGMIRLAAQLGRLLAADLGENITARPAAPGAQAQQQRADPAAARQNPHQAPGSPDADAELDRLTSEIFDASARNDIHKVNELSAKRAAIADRLFGGAPIVGSGLRKV